MGHRQRRARLVAATLAGALIAGACSSSDDSADPTSSTVSATTSTIAPTTTTAAPSVAWPAIDTSGPGAVVTPSGIVLAVVRDQGDGSVVARSPCGSEVAVTGTRVAGATVVLDPGHGGGETGAVGPGGTLEKAVNMGVAEAAKAELERLGATVVLTRTADYRITLRSRAAIATALRPIVFVSIHHNAEPDGPREGPGSETYFQIGHDASRRAAGLVYEEVTRALAAYDVDWVADRDAGAKYRPANDGGDYYGVLRRAAPVPAVLSEAAFLSNPPEEQLLSDPAVQKVEGQAIARAIVRFATTADAGSGFVEPYPRTQPAGPGGGPDGCVDPPLA